MEKNRFILSDLSVNCYGFVLLTTGIDLSAFVKNPVMLYNHNRHDAEAVIGKWNDITIEGQNLTANPEFDLDDDFAKMVANKVKKGFLNAASVGFDFKPEDVKLDVLGYEGVPVITKSILIEASITPTPGNANAIKLYNQKEQVVSNELSITLSNDFKQNFNPKPNMKKIIAVVSALGVALSAEANEDHIVEAINKIATDKDAEKAKITELNNKITELSNQLNAEKTNKVTDLIESAKKAGKITADQVEKFTKLANADFESTKSIIESITERKTIAASLNQGGANAGANANKFEGWDFKRFQKENPTELARIKANEPERYKELYLLSYPNAKM